MRKQALCVFVLLVLVTLPVVAASCGGAPTEAPAAPPAPTEAPAAPPTAAPTAEPAAVTAPEPTPVPTEAPAAPTAEPKGASGATDDVPRISVEELKAMVDSGDSVIILDARPKESFTLAHIAGAISYPWKATLTFDDVDELPCCGAPIVTYCDCGPGEFDSADVARQLIELDYDGEVMVLADPAIEGWIAAGYPTE